ncbi:hypothetical protein [Microbacterium sp. 4-7]|uniref:hypothetical protein n=1 Tax=Microbacterium sp. 4-7 TaxID=1885327 RepID=UPI00164FE6C0|nr:hypothetical protein [Microbacterium sp. 4-7]MBC6496096.1 hypothetical protein [Microbacterium sp. 4-7]
MAISEDQKAQVLALHAEGVARNEIARRVNIAAGSVTNICRDAGLTFDRSETKQATEARAVDLAAGRIRLAEKMLAASEGMLDVIDGPYEVYNFGGKDNTFESRVLDSAPVEVRRNIITTAGITFDKLTRIVEKSDTGLEQAVGVLDTLAEGFRAAADIYRGETPNEA